MTGFPRVSILTVDLFCALILVDFVVPFEVDFGIGFCFSWLRIRDGNFTHGYGYLRVQYPHGQGMGIFLYPWVLPIPYPFSHR
jgi:hypothetical protein